MTIAPRLFELYKRQGFVIVSGLNPTYWRGLNAANFTWLLRDGRSFTNGLGIALQEVYFLECLFAGYRPERILVIGNSFGWSAVALALLNPEARVVAMDAGFDENALQGIDLTNLIARDAGLNLTAARGVSPQDVGRFARDLVGGPVDFAFIDGFHDNDQVVLDFRAVRDVAAPEAVYLFHDVHAFDLYRGIAAIENESGLRMRRLMATPSGMAMAYPPRLDAAFQPLLGVFAPSPEDLKPIDAAALRHANPTRARWRRSLVKRRNRVRRWLGREPLLLP